jgi:PepSY-associated TM region
VLKRSFIFVHRWLGVTLCLFFLVWFPSGIGMMYWDFPSVTADDRLDRSAALDPSTIHLSPADAYAIAGQSQPPLQVRLSTFDGRPAYRFGTGSGETLVYADSGALQTGVISEALAARVASRWVGQPISAATVESLDRVDQWTVQGSFRTQRPLQKYSWPNGEQVYVSRASGEVVQYTTISGRIGAYLGPIPHWLYFTPLRRHQAAWSRVVIWTSGLATIAAALGLVVGVWTFSPARRYRVDGAPARVPYRAQKRWHMVLGLVFGAGAVTWAFSGMLSMDPVPSLATRPRADIQQAFLGRPRLTAFAGKDPRDALAQLRGLGVKQLELTVVMGEPVYLASLSRRETRIVPVAGQPRAEFDRERIAGVVKTASRPYGLVESRVLDHYDVYYVDRRQALPLPVMLFRLTDDEHTRYYIDPRTANVVGSYRSRNWMSRWLYHGLHSLDFPWLYDRRPLWDVVMIVFMLGGTALCVTSLMLAWRVIGSYLPAR